MSIAILISLIVNLALLVFVLVKLKNTGSLKEEIQTIITKQENLITLEEKSERTAREEFARNRDELGTSLKNSSELISTHMRDLSKLQNDQLNSFAHRLKEFGDGNRQDLTQMRQIIETTIKGLQEDNNKKLEEMRVTVDEKLQTTLETRLTSSFQQVSERLEQVHKGLGEMQNLATGVGDLKKVLTNVKTRGTWGEIQLGNLLEQILNPEQYKAQVSTKEGSGDRVDFAILLPGEKGSNQPIWLPIDSKFPIEDYNRLVEAQESANIELRDQAIKQLEAQIKLEAKKIKEKYLNPPSTTDFGLMFLPIEGLYAEVIRHPELVESIQRQYRITIVGPTTLGALLNALQMGFRTLTIQKHSSQVWQYLGEVRKHFGTFGDLLEKAHKKVQEATSTIEEAGKRSRTIENKLQKVQELSTETEPSNLLSLQNN